MALHTFDELQKIYDAAYMDKVLRNDSLAGIPFAAAIAEFYPAARIIADIGCANGVFMRHFPKDRYIVVGYDISVAARQSPLVEHGLIHTCDLRLPGVIASKYDLMYAIEFLEHIELEAIDTVLDNMCDATPIILATPGNQPGDGHFNMRPEQWWVVKFAEHGFVFQPAGSLKLREFLRQPRWDEHQRRFPFMKNGIMAFRRRTDNGS